MTSFWHPFADMAAVRERGELVIDRGEGVYVFDEAGRRYLDAGAALWFCNVGYGRTAIAEAAAEQLRRLPTFHTFGDLANRPVLELADRLAELAPVPGSASFFTSGGSDSVDTATKLARRYWAVVGRPEKKVIVVRENAYHGMHVAGTSLAGITGNREGYGELLGDVVRVAWDDPAALRKTIEQLGADSVAAFFCEPVIGAGGVLPPAPGYLAEVRRICREHDVLYVSDEVITGFGRAGDWFAASRFALEPDLVLCAKGITSGYLPLGAVIAAPRVAEPFFSGAGMWRHGYTYSGHAAAAAAALANLEIMAAEDLPGRVRAGEAEFFGRLSGLAAHPLVSGVRGGLGYLAAVQLDPDAQATRPGLAERMVAECRRHGVLVRALAGGALQISPALTITPEQVDELAAGIRAALDAVGE